MVPGRTVRAKVTADGQLLALRYLNGGNVLAIDRAGDSLSVSQQPAQLETRTMMKTGEIRSSLFAAADAVNLSDAVAIQLADIFSTDVDFHRDLRKGDRFMVVYEVFYHQGEAVKSGRVLAAEFINQAKHFAPSISRTPRARAAITPRKARTSARRFCVRPSNSRGLPPDSAMRAFIPSSSGGGLIME
jgi:hypothetical protein